MEVKLDVKLDAITDIDLAIRPDLKLKSEMLPSPIENCKNESHAVEI